MKLSISNICWSEENDQKVYNIMKSLGYSGLEIAPTRIFPKMPYTNLIAASEWKNKIMRAHGFRIPSMQSIWYGRAESVFGSDEERRVLTEYTKMAINFAEAVGCGNLVFGCPRNRSIPEGKNSGNAVGFFKEIGEYAADHQCVVAMEANPPIYNTNFLNTTEDALHFIREVDSEGFLLNLDVGTMVENGEDISILKGSEKYIHHVHISEPGLKPIRERALHRQLADLLRDMEYTGYVSIEAGQQESVDCLSEMMRYVREIFG